MSGIGSIGERTSSFLTEIRRVGSAPQSEEALDELIRGLTEEREERERNAGGPGVVAAGGKKELSDAQRYMINNVKTLALASTMIEDEEEEEDEEEGKGGKKSAKPGGELSKISFSDSRTDGGKDGGGAESEIVVMPDGSKVLILKTEISEGMQTVVKIPLGGGREETAGGVADEATDGMPQTGDAAAGSGVAGTA